MKQVVDRLISTLFTDIKRRQYGEGVPSCGIKCVDAFQSNCTSSLYSDCFCTTPSSNFTCCVFEECSSYLSQDETFNWVIDGCNKISATAPETFWCSDSHRATLIPSLNRISSTEIPTTSSVLSSTPTTISQTIDGHSIPSTPPSPPKSTTSSSTSKDSTQSTSTSDSLAADAVLQASKSRGLSTGAKAGIAIAIILLVALLAMLSFIIRRHRRRNRVQPEFLTHDDDLDAVRAVHGEELPTKANTHEAPGEIPHTEKGFYPYKVAVHYDDNDSGTTGVLESESPHMQKPLLPEGDAEIYIPPPRGEHELPGEKQARIIDVHGECSIPYLEMGSVSPVSVTRKAASGLIGADGEFLKSLGEASLMTEIQSGLQTGVGTEAETRSGSGPSATSGTASNNNSNQNNQGEEKEAKLAALQAKLEMVRQEKEKLTRLQELERLEEELKAEVMTAMRSS